MPRGITALRFHHRHNDDHTWDSICRNCFLTVATVDSEDDLAMHECNHHCGDLRLAKKPNHLEKLGVSDNPSPDWKYYPSARG